MGCKQGVLKQHSNLLLKLFFLKQKVQSYLDSRDSIQPYHKEHSFAYRHVKLIAVVHKVYCKTHRSPIFKTPEQAVTRSYLHHGHGWALPIAWSHSPGDSESAQPSDRSEQITVPSACWANTAIAYSAVRSIQTVEIPCSSSLGLSSMPFLLTQQGKGWKVITSSTMELEGGRNPPAPTRNVKVALRRFTPNKRAISQNMAF